MIAPTLLSTCVAALVISASAAPLEIKTALNFLPGVGDLTFAIVGPTEVPNILGGGLLKRTTTAEDMNRPIQTPHADRLSRNANFREADYGVNPAAAFRTLVPLEVADAAPSATSPPVRREQPPTDWRFAVPEPAAPAPSPTGLFKGMDLTKPDKLDVNNLLKPDMSPVFRAAANGIQGVGTTRYSTSNMFHQALGSAFLKPVDAQAAHANQTAPQANNANVTVADGSQALRSNATFPPNAQFNTGNPTPFKDSTFPGFDADKVAYTAPKPFPGFPQADQSEASVSDMQQINNADAAIPKLHHHIGTVVHGHHRRLLEPTQDLSDTDVSSLSAADTLPHIGRAMESVNALSQEMKTLLPRHNFELNTDALLPPPQGSNVDLTDPIAMYEYQQKKHVGLLNLDSNRPPAALPSPSLDALNPVASDAADAPKNVDDVQTAAQRANKSAKKAAKLAQKTQEITGKSDVKSVGGTDISNAGEIKNANAAPNTNSAVKGASKMVTKNRRLFRS